MDVGRHGSRSPCGLFSWLLAAAGTPSPVFRRRDSAPFTRPYRSGASREFPALRPAPTGSLGMILCRGCCGGVEGLRTRCVVRLSSRPVAPLGSPRHGALALSGHLVSWPGHAPSPI
ncbi:hypothetical protein NDU88_003630 [Pleurodeles waltl]|uniref:Secreted protein n=1 Tax=Pleurodeles waltl TaxID=8319 RepID=A0AAV7V0K3_PLEWA|nr:hypothetical protein NDU88_003630 [Pleurodeles waltl]